VPSHARIVELVALAQIERATATSAPTTRDQADRVHALGSSPCQANVIGPGSIVGSMPIVITDGTSPFRPR
jgi:hypothetical protein